ncbi:fimbrial protein [Salmonella enterica]|uniref:fimbrial protein n=1 Tax=Salmonella enterica TaxID=28901 RepID=UPI00406446B8
MVPAFASAATVTTPGGEVHFVGEVVNGTCAVDADSVNQTVQMGQVRANTLQNRVTSVKTLALILFEIVRQALTAMINTLPATAAIIFSGVTVDNTTNAKVLALQQLLLPVARPTSVFRFWIAAASRLHLTVQMASATIKLNEGTNTIPFQARYMATGQATAGTANADATFTVQYE